MKITVDPGLRTPVYQQIVDEVKRLVGSGALRSGERMASVRELGRALGVNPATVAKAYAELVSEGLLRAGSTSGTFVGPAQERPAPEAARARLERALDQLLAEIAACGLDEAQVRAAFERRLSEFEAGRREAPQAGEAARPAGPRRTRATGDWAVW
jgi:GntR family transcriptional regulator